MAVIKLVEDYAVRSLRNDVRDSLIMTGEQAVLLNLYHPGDPDAVPCPECGDDTYESPEKHCTSCYGTMFDRGVRKAMRVWTLFTDHEYQESLEKRGTYQPDHRSFQFEAFPRVTEHDVIVRVSQWDGDKALKVDGYYLLDKVTQRSLRTGSRSGQKNWDIVGQKAQVAKLPDRLWGITSYPIKGRDFEEAIEIRPGQPTVPAQAMIEPSVSVVYFPFSEATGAPVVGTPSGGSGEGQGFTYTQSIPTSVWTITHDLGYVPNVSITANGEEIEAEVDFPNNSVVVIHFGVPVAGQARLT